ncbi:MAG: FkbM family methyltransferase [Sulfuritalea sp.]|nr:FkbM family methyltransferase [Sulfuritalea sp.]
MAENSIQDAFTLAVALHRQGRIAEALRGYEQVLREFPDHLAASANAAALLQQAGRLPEAVSCYSRAVRLSPDNPRLKFSLGYLLLRLRRTAEALPLLEAAAAADPAIPLVAELAAYARFRLSGKAVAEFFHDGVPVRFRVADHNLGLDIFHVSGSFFEAAELEHCRAAVKPRAVIVDVGANVGNHLVYFAHFMAPARIFPVEPHPESIRLLRENIALNRLACVDERHLGIGIGGERGRLAIDMPAQGDLVLARLTPSPAGNIEVYPLDDLDFERIDLLKIDVEGMEFDVLRGMSGTLRRCRPVLMIEVREADVDRFVAAMGDHRYRLEREFAGIGYKNLFLLPEH